VPQSALATQGYVIRRRGGAIRTAGAKARTANHGRHDGGNFTISTVEGLRLAGRFDHQRRAVHPWACMGSSSAPVVDDRVEIRPCTSPLHTHIASQNTTTARRRRRSILLTTGCVALTVHRIIDGGDAVFLPEGTHTHTCTYTHTLDTQTNAHLQLRTHTHTHAYTRTGTSGLIGDPTACCRGFKI
jgi:hypothetical protein